MKIIKQKWISWHKRFEWKKIPKCEVLENSDFSKITKNVKKGSKFEICHLYFKSSSYTLKYTICPIFSCLSHFLRILCQFLCFWFFQILPTILSLSTIADNTNIYTIGCCIKNIEYWVTKIWQLVYKWYRKILKPFLQLYIFV